jgi:hypothetical protein
MPYYIKLHKTLPLPDPGAPRRWRYAGKVYDVHKDVYDVVRAHRLGDVSKVEGQLTDDEVVDVLPEGQTDSVKSPEYRFGQIKPSGAVEGTVTIGHGPTIRFKPADITEIEPLPKKVTFSRTIKRPIEEPSDAQPHIEGAPEAKHPAKAEETQAEEAAEVAPPERKVPRRRGRPRKKPPTE